MFGLPPWTGDMQTFPCQPCMSIPWPRGWILSACRPHWTGGFPKLRPPSWGEHSSSSGSSPQKQWPSRIPRGLEPQLLGLLSMFRAKTIWSIEFLSLGLVSKGSLINLSERLPLVLRGLVWVFPNRQAKQGGFFLTLLRFLGIFPLLNILRRYLKKQWFRLWFQTRIFLLFCPKS